VIVLVIRSRKPFFRSTPGRYLLAGTLLTVGMTLIFPVLPLGRVFGFTPLPWSFLLVLGGIVALYVLAAEAAKKAFYARVKF
jgi:Mg2+-importing ATPase